MIEMIEMTEMTMLIITIWLVEALRYSGVRYSYRYAICLTMAVVSLWFAPSLIRPAKTREAPPMLVTETNEDVSSCQTAAQTFSVSP